MLLFGLHIPSVKLHFQTICNPEGIPLIYLKNDINTSISFYSSVNVNKSWMRCSAGLHG